MGFTRRDLSLALAAVTATTPGLSLAQDQKPATSTRVDGGGRLTLPVMINGTGPFSFAVDSAANASVVSSDLAEQLGLAPVGEVEIHSLIARERAFAVRAASLQTGALNATEAQLVVGTRDGLGSVAGLIGTDLLASYRLTMSFRGRRLHVGTSRSESGAFFAEGRSRVSYRAPVEQRFTNLMMIEGRAGGVTCRCIVDTGSQITIINRPLAEASRARPLAQDGSGRTSTVYSPTGSSQQAEAMVVPVIGFGGVSFRRVPVLVGNFHTFRLWGLEDQPAMLLGVDLLGLFDRVTIDLKRSEIILDT